MTPRFQSVDEMLADARSRLSRLDPMQVRDALAQGARLVDIRPAWQRIAEGEVPGSLIVERNHLEWRLAPRSPDRVPTAIEGQRWIVMCSAGYASSLAAASLCSLGIPATDMIGGFSAWAAAGLPTVAGGTGVEDLVGEAGHVPPRLDPGLGVQLGPKLHIVEVVHSALGVLNDDDLAGAESALTDRQRAKHVVGDHAAGIADQMGIADL